MTTQDHTQAGVQMPENAPSTARRGLRRSLVAASMLVPLAGAAAVALAQTGSGVRPAPAAPSTVVPPVGGANGDAVSVLMERANFWRNQQQFDQALAALSHALELDPRNTDALALTSQIQAERGNGQAAQSALGRLRQAAPDDQRIPKIEAAIKIGPISQDSLAEARRLVREGRQAEAVDRYNRVFRGATPPDNLAVEYYQTLSGTAGGWEQARDGLARTVRENPNDVRAQLAYAQVLSYHDEARTDGVNRLALLARNPAVGDQATQAWRQALNWLPAVKESVGPITDYLAVHPNDGDLQAKLEASRNPPPDPNDPAAPKRVAGFDQLNTGKLNDAAAAFQAAIEANPNDADATGGLGIVRLRQRRLDEARTLLTKAIALDPANKNRWQPALNGVASAIAGGQPNPALALMSRGDYPAAEAELQRQVRGGATDPGLSAMLADAQARQNKLAAAEQSYRQALARNPRYAPALLGLAGVLGQQGRHQEAVDLLRAAEAAGGDRRLVGQARALQLREQASAITDPGTQAGLLRSAIEADPSNPWLRLDYARALVKDGLMPQARAVMAQVVAGNASSDAIKAGIAFANETSDPDAAASLLARVPPAQRTADMRSLYANVQLQRDIGQLLDLPRVTARSRLLALANVPDPDGARGAAIARALSSIGDTVTARRAIVVARDATPNQNPGARIAYAGALLDIGDATGAQIMLQPLRTGAGLTKPQKAAFDQLRAGLAVKTADDLNQAGRQADGYDKLAPALAANPDNPDMNLALARLYSGAKEPTEALEINQALLRRDPGNAEARRGAVAAALQSGNRKLAEKLVAEGLELAPEDPKSWMASADVARFTGNNARALRDLERARSLRLQQLGYADNGNDDSTLTNVTLAPGDAPLKLRTPVAVQVAPIGSKLPPSRAPYTYGTADKGDDTIPPLAIPPILQSQGNTGPAPTPLYQPYQGQTPRAPAASPQQASPSYFPQLPSAPLPVPAQLPPPPYNPQQTAPTQLPPMNAAPGRLLNTNDTSTLPAPRGTAPASRGDSSSADALNARALNGQAPAYAAPAAIPAYGAPSYPAPGYATPTSSTPPSYPAAPAGYNQPQYAAPTYPAYQPYQPYQNAGVPPASQLPAQMRYQSQAQEYLPQYRPAPPPTAGEAAAADDALLTRNDDFNKPYRPALPRLTANGDLPFTDERTTQPVPFYDNPFRRSPDQALLASNGVRPGNGTTAPDAVTQEIDRGIVELRDSIAPTMQAGFSFRNRSGDSGLDKLTEVGVPLEATYSPSGAGTLKVNVTPTVLTGGTVSMTGTNIQRFGTSALYITPAVQGPPYVAASYYGATPKSQTAQGVAFSASLAGRWASGDIGTTPVGFKIQNLVGGVEFNPQVTDHLRLRVGVERRAMTDSILSYAGTVDTNSGKTWGGAVRTRVHGALEFTAGPADFYLNAGGGSVTGTNMSSNTETDIGAGASYPIFKDGDDEVRVGVDLSYINYSKNLSYFTYGQGGYFSPQNFVAAMIPVTYRSKIDADTSYEIGISVGEQSFTSNQSNFFPNNPTLQAQLNATKAYAGFSNFYPSKSSSGIAGQIHGKFDYRVSPSLYLGGGFTYQNIGEFNEASGMLFAKYVFNGTKR